MCVAVYKKACLLYEGVYNKMWRNEIRTSLLSPALLKHNKIDTHCLLLHDKAPGDLSMFWVDLNDIPLTLYPNYALSF